MAKRFGWLDRGHNEPVSGYDKRINELAAFHAGYAFLTWANYCEEYSAFAVYVVWNGECNSKLANPMPPGGFMMHCDRAEAEQLMSLGHGLPVFIKLYSKLGILRVDQQVLADGERIYDLYFNGCECVTPDNLCFAGREDMAATAAGKENSAAAACSYPRGSYVHGSFIRGSFRRGSYVFGAIPRGFHQAGSYRQGSYGTGFGKGSYYTGYSAGGSYARGSYSGAFGGSYSGFGLSGSYLRWLFGGGSYMSLLFGFGSGFYTGGYGSFFYGSYMHGSYLSLSSYVRGMGGSYNYAGVRSGSFLNGSYYGGSYRLGSFTRGGFMELPVYSQPDSVAGETSGAGDYTGRRVRRLTWELGYGLDLI